MSTPLRILSASIGLNGSEVIAPGATATAGSGRKVAFLLPLGGDATITTVVNGPTNLPNPTTLTQDVAYPFSCDAVTVDGGSVGSLYIAYL